MFKYVFGLTIVILLVLAFSPVVMKWGNMAREYFHSMFTKEVKDTAKEKQENNGSNNSNT